MAIRQEAFSISPPLTPGTETPPAKIVLFGGCPWAGWTGAFLKELIATTYTATSESSLPSVEAGPNLISIQDVSAERLQDVATSPFAAVILLDSPDAVTTPAHRFEAPFLNTLLTKAERLVFAIELARRADRRVVAEHLDRDRNGWLHCLAHLVCGKPVSPDAACSLPMPALRAGDRGSDSDTATDEAPTYGITVEERQAIEKMYLEPLRHYVMAGGRLIVRWPRELFFDGDSPGQRVSPVIDLAGRARIVCYGPYLVLPVGEWQVLATVGFSHDINGLPFIIEVAAGKAIRRGYFKADSGGIFTVELSAVVEQPLVPVEVRMISQESALEGQMAFIEVEFTLVEQSAPPIKRLHQQGHSGGMDK